MIIARGIDRKTDEQLLVLGLSHANIKKLMEKKPMVLTRKTHGDGVPENWQIVIFTGTTEDAMTDEFKALGIIGPNTPIY